MAPIFLLLLATLLVSVDCYDRPQTAYPKQLEPSWQSTETVANDHPQSAISEQFLKNVQAESKQQQLHSAHLASVPPLQSSLQEEVAVSAVPGTENGEDPIRRVGRLFFNSIPSFTFAPLQAIVSGISGLVQPFASPVGQIGLFPEITTVYSTYYSSGTQTVTQSFVSTKNTFWTTTTTSVPVTLSSTSTSTTTPVSVSVSTYASTALLTSSSTASSTTTITGTSTYTTSPTSTSTSTSTSTAQTTYSSTEVQVSLTVLPTQTSVSTTTETSTAYTSTNTVFVTQTNTNTVNVAVCVTDAAQAAILLG